MAKNIGTVIQIVGPVLDIRFADGDGDSSTGIGCFCATLQAVGRGHSDATSNIVTDVLSDLSHDGSLAMGDLDCGQQLRQAAVGESDVKNRTHDLDHSSDVFGHRIQLLV